MVENIPDHRTCNWVSLPAIRKSYRLRAGGPVQNRTLILALLIKRLKHFISVNYKPVTKGTAEGATCIANWTLAQVAGAYRHTGK